MSVSASPSNASAAPAPAAVLAEARELLAVWHRRRVRAAAGERVLRALTAGGLAAAAAGAGGAFGIWGWGWCAGAGLAGALVTLVCRPPWRGLPSPADTALSLERRAGWRNAASTLLTVTDAPEVPGGGISPAAAAFARWLAPWLPQWRALHVPGRPSAGRYLLPPLCLLLAEFLLGTADGASSPDAPVSGTAAPAPGAFPAVRVLPAAAGNLPEGLPRLDPAAVAAPLPETPDANPGEASSGQSAGIGEGAGGRGGTALGPDGAVFRTALPALAPAAVRHRLENATVPPSYRHVITRYRELTPR